MLCQFSFRNFKSYREETVFDLQATAIPEFADSLIRMEKCSGLLPVGVVYGPNGGGKTNLLEALACLVSTVVKPIHDLEKSRKTLIRQQKISAEPFLYDEDSALRPTEFQVYFRTGAYEYRYSLGILRGEITAEALDRKKIGGKKPAHIYNREKDKITLGAILQKEGVNTRVNGRMPFLSFLVINYNIPVIAPVQEWFEACVFRSHANPTAEMQIMASADAVVKKQILTLLNDMDVDVVDYRIDQQENQLYLKREIAGHVYELSFAQESDGIRKLIAVLPMLLIALQEGRLVIIDDLDAKLHPKLLRYVISMFTNSKINRHGAQLLFTSHDMATLKNTVFRRDEIWFAALTEGRSSEIYSLHDIRREDNERVNSTAAYDKQYLEGRYGADPCLRNMVNGCM